MTKMCECGIAMEEETQTAIVLDLGGEQNENKKIKMYTCPSCFPRTKQILFKMCD